VDRTQNRIIEGRYLQDILDQPQALQATLDSLRADTSLFARIAQLRRTPHARIVLTGMGSSLHAQYPLELMLTAQGETVVRVDSSELIHSMPALLSSESIIVAVSQSGQSAEIVKLLEMNNGRAKVIGVTNTAGSPLAVRSDVMLLTQCGDEYSVSAKTYVATLAALEVLGAAWCGVAADDLYAELLQVPAMVSSYLKDWREHVESLAAEMEGVTRLFIVGRGRSLAASATGALTTKESTRTPAEGMSSAAFRHGPMEMSSPQTMVLVFEGQGEMSALNAKLVRDVHAWSGRSELIGPAARVQAFRIPAMPARLLPIVEILPIQMMILAVAANLGLEAGQFVHATKITSVE
jgi:glucosamine--fructose-6-phosphate aminotransferase (isomerizing)